MENLVSLSIPISLTGVVEASERYKVWKTFKDNKEQLEIEKNKKKPAPFKLVKVCRSNG